ncbi:MAG: transglycosylase SLT domain-containing protein, partial [Vulcanimicrobiaceae bacterium]
MSVLGDLARVEARIARLDKRCPTVPGGAEGAAFTSLIATPAPVAVAGRRPANVLTLVDARARAHGVDPRLVAAVVEVESGFDANATSPVGAQGLMQLMPATARSLG